MISICIKINNDSVLNYVMNEIKKSKLSEMYYKKHQFKIYNNLIVHYKGTDSVLFYDLISNIISNCIIKYFEPNIVNKLINSNYFYFDKPDRDIIYKEYLLIKQKNLKSIKSIKNVPINTKYYTLSNISNYKRNIQLYKKLVYQPLKDYLLSNKSIVLTGFINFRLTQYIRYLENMVSEAVNQYLIDKEYLKFVDLLKNYVLSKVPNNEIINLIYTNSEGILLTADGKYVKLENFNSTYLSDVTFSKNDYILNTLIGLLPNKIIVHLISPKDQFIKTIEMIFENRVEICKGCEFCKTYSLLNLH